MVTPVTSPPSDQVRGSLSPPASLSHTVSYWHPGLCGHLLRKCFRERAHPGREGAAGRGHSSEPVVFRDFSGLSRLTQRHLREGSSSAYHEKRVHVPGGASSTVVSRGQWGTQQGHSTERAQKCRGNGAGRLTEHLLCALSRVWGSRERGSLEPDAAPGVGKPGARRSPCPRELSSA